MSSILVVEPPTDSGLKLACSGDSSATQNPAPSIDSCATTLGLPAVPPTWYTTSAPNAAR